MAVRNASLSLTYLPVIIADRKGFFQKELQRRDRQARLSHAVG
jgi:hypothetical protein